VVNNDGPFAFSKSYMLIMLKLHGSSYLVSKHIRYPQSHAWFNMMARWQI
jgi:hypothetical protein